MIRTWALLRWCSTKRRYIKCTYLYLYLPLPTVVLGFSDCRMWSIYSGEFCQCYAKTIVISLRSVLAPYNDSRIVYAARERILAATFNYIRRSGRQLWFFQCRESATTTFFVISEVIFVFHLQCWQYHEIRHISAYTQQCNSSNWINQSWNLMRRDVIRRNKQTNKDNLLVHITKTSR